MIGSGILIGGFYYWYISGSPGGVSGSSGPKRDPDQFEVTLATLRKLKNINFDQRLFREPAFLLLQKPNIPAAADITPGRANPFLSVPNAAPSGEKSSGGKSHPSV